MHVTHPILIPRILLLQEVRVSASHWHRAMSFGPEMVGYPFTSHPPWAFFLLIIKTRVVGLEEGLQYSVRPSVLSEA